MINLFVSRLDYGVTQDDLINLFKPYGFVKKVSIPLDKETGKPRGIAFIEINADDAQSIIDALDGHSLNNRAISVKVAEDRGTRPNPQINSNRPDRRSFDTPSRPQGSQRDFSRPNRPESRKEANDISDESEISYHTKNAPNPSLLFSEDLPSKSERNPKKSKDKKGFSSNTNDGPKKGKMQAYKKSGKNNRFFDDDDDDGDFTFEY